MGRRNCRLFIATMLMCVLLSGAYNERVLARTVTESASANMGVTISPNGLGWTLDKGVQKVEKAEVGACIMTGQKSTLGELERGYHFYEYKRTGEVPIGSWRATMEQGKCIHTLGARSYANLKASGYLGLTYPDKESTCGAYYMPGWTGLCADCGEPVLATGEKGYEKPFYIYGSGRSVAALTSLDVNLDYYYQCPFCSHLEQGAGKRYHTCRQISANRYRVVYLLKEEDKFAGAGGSMRPSLHMYNNSTEYEGKRVTPCNTLSKCTFTYTGHVIKEWVLTEKKDDGSFHMNHDVKFSPEAEIWNLTTEHWKDETSPGGTVYLTAVWERAVSELQIDAGAGSYEGKEGVTSIRGAFQTTYKVQADKLEPSRGYQVQLMLRGGKLPEGESILTAKKKFVQLLPEGDFKGVWSSKTHTYGFLAPDGHTDRLKVVWGNGSVVLPVPVRDGYAFGGWYMDTAGKHLAGTGGNLFTPSGDITLYAKWVDLSLDSIVNYSANDGRGAVDLTWKWGENPGANQYAYMIYQRKPGESFVALPAGEGRGDTTLVQETFVYDKSEGSTYTVPYSGIYVLTAAGAAGGSNAECGEKNGGKGGGVRERIWLNEGDVLTYTCGGSDGTSGGGRSETYGCGGGYTVVTSREKGILMIAGGGGGATPGRDGGDGGYEVTEPGVNRQGENGTAGGGGGAIGGSAGIYDVHVHTEKCILLKECDYSLLESGWWSDYGAYAKIPTSWYGRNDGYKEGTVTSDLKSIYLEKITHSSLEGHTVNVDTDRGPMLTSMLLELGAVYGPEGTKVYPGFSEGYIPVMGNGEVYFDLLFHAWGDERGKMHHTKECNRMRIYDQNNRLIYDKPLSAYEHKIVSDNAQWNYRETDYYIRDSLEIPEGTTSVYFSCYVEDFYGTDRMLSLKVNSIRFTGGVEEDIICGYEEGEILQNVASAGGGSWVNKQEALAYEFIPGSNAGAGYWKIESIRVGFIDDTFRNSVPAADITPPPSLLKEDISVEWAGDGMVDIIWPDMQKLPDNKTAYEHKVVAYHRGGDADAIGIESNIALDELGGIKGFLVQINHEQDTLLTDGELLTDSVFQVELTRKEQYFHIAVVDMGDNVSETTHVRLGALDIQGEKPVDWPLYTLQTELSGEEGIYRREDGVYFVRADGRTDFLLISQGGMEGIPREDYQINKSQIFGEEGLARGVDVAEFPNHQIWEELPVPEADIITYEDGVPLLREQQYVRAVRSHGNRDLYVERRFVLDAMMDARCVFIYPGVAAYGQKGEVTSDAVKDRTHGLFITGDGKAPTVQGMDEVRSQGMLVFDEEGSCTYVFKAHDGGSGMASFYATLTNKDTGLYRTIYSENAEKLTLALEEEDEILSGNTELMVYAVDNVGNVTVESTEFTLFGMEVSVRRILPPHETVFKAGESGVLQIRTYGYVSRIEVTYPPQWHSYMGQEKQLFEAGEHPGRYWQEEMKFMVPLNLDEEADYTFTVKAFKDDREVLGKPQIAVVKVKGSVLDELRTRLR